MRIREISQTKQALGGDITLAIVTDLSSKDVDSLYNELWRQIYMFERRFSRFLPMSELSVFNRSAGIKTKITSEFKKLLTSAQQLSIETGGLFNPFIIPALQRAGYMKSAALGYERDVQTDYTSRRVVGIDRLVIGDDWATIPYGTALDMGGCGKGYLVDQLSKSLKIDSIYGYWLSLSGDIATMGRDKNGHNLTLSIQSADDLSSTTDWIVDCPLGYSAVATSGTFRRKGQNIKKDWHHIIDPVTLEPAITDIRLATVCADTALRADVFASCAVILGSKKAPAFLKKHGIKSSLFQCINKEGVTFEKKMGSLIKKSQVCKQEEISIDA